MIRTANISIEDFQKICRACMLKQPTKKLFPLTTNSIDIELFEITKVQLNNNPVLPNSICVKCQSTLKSAIRFKRQVLDAEVKLNKILLQLDDKSVEQQKLDSINNLKIEEALSDQQIFQSHEENQTEDTCDLSLEDSIDSCSETSRNSNEKFSESKIVKKCLDNRRTKRKAFKLPIDNNKTQRLIKSKRKKPSESHENIDFDNKALEKKNVKKMHSCPECLLTFKYDCGLKAHMVKHGKLMQCEPCGTTYKSLKIYEKHVKQHPEYKPFNCLFCEKKFAVISTLKKHRKLHDCDNPFLCKVCGKSFVHGFALKSHLRIHTGEKPYTCNICQVSYSTSSFLVIHKRTHTMERPYQCQACPKAFISNCALKAHVKTHTGEKKFMCPMCGKGAARLPDLNIHMRFHTGERPYSCDQCPKTFPTSSNLSAHKRTHTGEKNHICEVCSKAFGEAQTLKRHFRIHTGEKPYECKDCGKRYMQSGQLKIHQKTHTKLQEKMQISTSEFLQNINLGTA